MLVSIDMLEQRLDLVDDCLVALLRAVELLARHVDVGAKIGQRRLQSANRRVGLG